MEITYYYTADDHALLQKELAPKGITHKPFVIIFSSVYLFFVFADLLYGTIIGTFDWTSLSFLPHLIARSIVGLGLLWIVVLILDFASRHSARKAVDPTSKNGVFCEHKIILDEDGFTEITDVNSSRHLWTGIESVEETKNFILIILRMSAILAIPRASITGPRTADEFVEQAKLSLSGSQHRFIPSFLDRP